jgi:hypothetical protein
MHIAAQEIYIDAQPYRLVRVVHGGMGKVHLLERCKDTPSMIYRRHLAVKTFHDKKDFRQELLSRSLRRVDQTPSGDLQTEGRRSSSNTCRSNNRQPCVRLPCVRPDPTPFQMGVDAQVLRLR